jgi:hypothetical protein
VKSIIKKSAKAILSGLGYEIKKVRETGADPHIFPPEPFEAQCRLIHDSGKTEVTVLTSVQTGAKRQPHIGLSSPMQ